MSSYAEYDAATHLLATPAMQNGSARQSVILVDPRDFDACHFVPAKSFLPAKAVCESIPYIPVNQTRVISIVVRPALAFLRSWKTVEETLQQWSSLPEDWDGPDTPKHASGAIAKIRQIVSLGRQQGIPEPKPYYAADAELGLIWKSADIRATISFLPDGSQTAYLGRKGKDPILVANGQEWQIERHRFFRTIKESFK